MSNRIGWRKRKKARLARARAAVFKYVAPQDEARTITHREARFQREIDRIMLLRPIR